MLRNKHGTVTSSVRIGLICYRYREVVLTVGSGHKHLHMYGQNYFEGTNKLATHFYVRMIHYEYGFYSDASNNWHSYLSSSESKEAIVHVSLNLLALPETRALLVSELHYSVRMSLYSVLFVL